MQFAARGVKENPTAGAEDLMVWVHATLKHGLENEEKARAVAEGAVGAAGRVEEDNRPGSRGQSGSTASRASGEAGACKRKLWLRSSIICFANIAG
jgi:hypothetical protein